MTNTVLPGLGSEAGGQLTEGTSAEPYARIGGAVLGGMSPSLARRAVTPLPISPERQAVVDALMQQGVQPTAGQLTGRRGLQFAESEIGGGATARLMDEQRDAYTRAVLNRVGENAPRATPQVMDNAFTRIGQQFDDLAARNTMQADQQLVADLQGVWSNYSQLVGESARAPGVSGFINDIGNALQRNNGALPGEVYQSFRSRLQRMERGTKDVELGDALQGMREALDGAMERSMSPADVAAWREARRQYRNIIVVERASTGAGPEAAMGAISPANLRTASVGQSRRGYVRGDSDFSELAHAGQSILTPMPDSGTAARMAARGVPAVLGGMLGGEVGGVHGMMAGAVAPFVAGRALMSRPVQAYLGNQALPGGEFRSALARQMVIDALMHRAVLPEAAP